MSDYNPNENLNKNEDLETVLKVVSFCIPIVGAVLYFVNKDKAPVKAKSACNMALYGYFIKYHFLRNGNRCICCCGKINYYKTY